MKHKKMNHHKNIIKAFITTKVITDTLRLIPSSHQTKNWRENTTWYQNSRKNTCEKYQRNLIEKIICTECKKTTDRINIRKNIIQSKFSFVNDVDGFDWTEDFDGKVLLNNDIYYFNFKMICDQGGSQTRSMREVYWFIDSQINYIEKNNDINVKFINILDGNGNSKHLFQYKNLEQYMNKSKDNIYIGDLYNFRKWWDDIIIK